MTKLDIAWVSIAIILASIRLGACPQAVVKAEVPQASLRCSEPFSGKTGWSLNVNSDGSASLTMNTHPKPTIRTFKVSPKELDTFRKSVSEQRFFDLGAEYGSHVPDSGKSAIAVHIGDKSKTVTLLFVSAAAPDISEVKRVLLVWQIARKWFNDAGAVDMQAYDKKILDTHNPFVKPGAGS